MSSNPGYSASRAANVALAIAVAAALVCVGAGLALLRDGSATGWLLIVAGVLPLLGAVWVRGVVRRTAAGDDENGAAPHRRA